MRAVLALALVVALTGCGRKGYEEYVAERDGTPDAEAIQAATDAADVLESCDGGYANCQDDAKQGAVESVATTRSGYRLRARSETGTTFKLVRRKDGTIQRTCSKPGAGDCDAAGTWTPQGD